MRGSLPDIGWQTRLLRDGYALFPGLLAGDKIRAARALIDRDLAENYDPARQIEYDHRSYCPRILTAPAILTLLLETPVRRLLDAAIGFDTLDFSKAQIAIRRAHNAAQRQEPEPHIDGIATPHNGVTTKYLSNFTVLVGIYLSDVAQDYAGNFTVWPGSHRRIEAYFRARGPAAAMAGMPRVDLGSPVQLRCRAGDVVLCHYQLAHAAALNLSPNDRFAIYFRLWLSDIARRRWELLTHIWRGWKIGPGAAARGLRRRHVRRRAGSLRRRGDGRSRADGPRPPHR